MKHVNGCNNTSSSSGNYEILDISLAVSNFTSKNVPSVFVNLFAISSSLERPDT